MEIQISPGRHAVALEMQGYQMALEEFEISPGRGHTVNVALQASGSAYTDTVGYGTEGTATGETDD